MAGARLRVERIRPRSTEEQLRKTIALVGKGIRAGSVYPPIRMWASAVAARAVHPKNYLEQLGELYREFTNQWHYVRDPLLAELVHVSGPAIWDHVFGAVGGVGRGDCDCASSGFGAACASVGFPVRLAVSKKPGARWPGHIYPEIFVKGPNRWIPADPVAYPQHGVGYETPNREIRRFDLWGRNISGELAGEEVNTMFGEVETGMQDYGLEAYGYAGLGGEPEPWGSYQGPIGFGAYADGMGIMGGFGMFAEVEPDAHGLARTPMLEIHPRDFHHMRRHGRPYHGMCALGDDGSVYQYDGLSGFFGKLFKGAKKLIGGIAKGAHKMVMGVGKAIWKGTKGILKKLPGGKYLVKFAEKIHGIAMKLVRPLAKIVGKLAKKIAPIAAMIPGYGPVISAALYAGGTIATEMSKHGVKQTATGKLILPKDPNKVHAFRLALKQHAEAKKKEVHARHARGESVQEIIHGKGAGRKPVAPGHAPAGTPMHKAALRAMGVKQPTEAAPPAMPAGAPAAIAPAALPPAGGFTAPGGWQPPPAWWAEQQAEWTKEQAGHPAAQA